MRILVLYDTSFGNTESVARAIATALAPRGSVEIHAVADAPSLDRATVDLLLVGGPTQRHGASEALGAWFQGLPRDALKDVPAATFDTRYRIAKLVSGSAAEAANRWLRRAGCRLIAPPESFFIERDAPPDGEKRRHQLEHLEAGELERAAEWARGLPGAA